MANRNLKQKTVNVHDFAMIPRSDIPRASFRMEKGLKTAISASFLVPIFCEEVLPGDTWKANLTIVARTSTPIVPVMDNWHLETFFFFVPNRLVWDNWERFMGEQDTPASSISFVIPQVVSPAGGFAVNSLYDYFGLPCVGQTLPGNTISVNSLPFRCYNFIYNEWFKDQNIISNIPRAAGDGPDPNTDYVLRRRGKRHDYFTSALPWTQKFTAPLLPLGTQAPVRTLSTEHTTTGGVAFTVRRAATGAFPTADRNLVTGANGVISEAAVGSVGANTIYPTNLYAILSEAIGSNVNQLRQSIAIQRLLERDARGGTRYIEIVKSQFGVQSLDARLDRPEYLGGGHTRIQTEAIAQTSGTGASGQTTPLASLAAIGYAHGNNSFSYNATEHGYIIGLINARADLTYHQGTRKLFLRQTRYDFYTPAFAHLGEQAILQRELYSDGSAQDSNTHGFQERWAEYRYNPSQITGIFRPRSAGNLAFWHSAENFVTPPALNQTFIEDQSDVVLQRNFQAGALSANQQFLLDMLYTMNVARAMPMYSVPGLMDHF